MNNLNSKTPYTQHTNRQAADRIGKKEFKVSTYDHDYNVAQDLLSEVEGMGVPSLIHKMIKLGQYDADLFKDIAQQIIDANTLAFLKRKQQRQQQSRV